MAVFLSAGVFPREIDLSILPREIGPTRPAFIGTAQKGPMNEPTLVTSAEQYIDVFGEPFPESFLGYAVLGFMEGGNQAYVLRVGVECEEGQVDELADICIDTSGANVEGWGRIPVFTGIDFGRINLREVSTDNPLDFHDASATFIEFNDIDVSASDGPASGTMTFTGGGAGYTGSIDDSFIMLITSGPTPTTGSFIDGAEYEIIKNSDGSVVTTGTIVDAGGNISTAIDIGDGIEFTITITGSALEEDDTFHFSVAPDNKTFSVSVDLDLSGLVSTAISHSFTDGDSYTSAADFVDAFNLLLGGSDEYSAIVSSGVPQLITDTAGDLIQAAGTEAWALEVGIQKWTYDIPRSHIEGQDEGTYTITSQNDRVRISVIGDESTQDIDVSIPNSLTSTPSVVTSALRAGGVVTGERYYGSFPLQVTDDDEHVVIMTSDDHIFDQVKLQATFSFLETLRFADELDIPAPYTNNYRVFSDTRVEMPEAGTVTPSVPATCEADPASDECVADTAFFANIVGFFVAKTPGTWIDSFTLTLSNYNDTAGRYQLEIFDAAGLLVDRIDDISFDPREDRYIANIVNEGSSIGGINGNAYVQWEERPTELGNDPVNDLASLEVRLPGALNRSAFSGSANGIPTDALFSSELDRAIIGNPQLNTGIFAFQNIDTFDINLLAIPGNSSGSVIGQALQLCESRGDCLYIVDPPFGLRPQQVVDWHNGLLFSDLAQAINSSYGALYWGWLKIFDQFSGQEIFVPPSGHVLSVFARTERVAEQWVAPAGLRRGRLITPLEIEYNPTKGERDLLYGSGNSVNPIVNFNQDGIAVWGQRTLQRTASALDRVNVRMLLIFLKKRLIRLLRNFVFEPNDRFLWAQTRNAINPFLADIQARRGIEAYKVVVDETNNTPERRDRNELWVSIFIKPTKTAEFIVLNLVVMRSEQSFALEEVLQAGGVVGNLANA